MRKLVKSLREALELCGLRDGMTLSFHHHLRDGDGVLNRVMEQAAGIGARDLTVSASALLEVHAPLAEWMRRGVVTGIDTDFMGRAVGAALLRGELQKPAVFRTHGGRAASILSGEQQIDIAFIAAPCCDADGGMIGTEGPSAFGSMGYAIADAAMAKKVVVLTDHLVERLENPSISGDRVDCVVCVDSIGDAAGIVSGTTRITRDPVGHVIAKNAAAAAFACGAVKEGFSVQAGAGGVSLAVMQYIRDRMRRDQIGGAFGLGGITGYFVDMLGEGLLQTLYDVQCFDLQAVASLRENGNHREISAARYASPDDPDALVNRLDVVFLGATEIDREFNVNVHTDSAGRIIGGSGGHSDTAAGARLSVVVAPLYRSRTPVVVERVRTVSTPGRDIDLLVTQRGLAVNPARPELERQLRAAGLEVRSMEELHAIALRTTGVPQTRLPKGPVVGRVLGHDGRETDVIRRTI